MNLSAQTLAATAIGLRSIPRRSGNSLVIVLGIAGVVAVLISVLAMWSGFAKTIHGGARADRVIVVSQGVQEESVSALSRANIAALAAAAGVKRDERGKPLLSAEIVLVAPVARRNGVDAYITLRGIGEQHFAVRPELQLVAGRMFNPGLHEMIVGRSAQLQFAGVALGDHVRLHDGDWTIVGVFTGGDNVRESEVLADAETVLSAYKLDSFNSATALLEDRAALSAFKDAVGVEPSLKVTVFTEPEYLAMVSASINRLLRTVALMIGTIMAIGALFGALNTMYSAVTSRKVEIATLHAIGYRAGPVVGSILIEALLLALAGAALGILLAYLAFDGRSISTLGGTRWDSQVVYALSITPGLVAIATALACAIGLLGGLFPALRVARSKPTDALRVT